MFFPLLAITAVFLYSASEETARARAVFKYEKPELFRSVITILMGFKDNALFTYVRQSKDELKKVAWPTKRQTLNYTILVIVISIAMAAFLGGLDFVFARLFSVVIS